MSHDFRLYTSGDTFLDGAWQGIMVVGSAQPVRTAPASPWHAQWMTKAHVWVTVQGLANTQIVRPWAQWCVTLDFSAGQVDQCFDAISIIALALVELPRVEGIRVQATDAFDDASADTVDEWTKIAVRYLDQESVADIVEWAATA